MKNDKVTSETLNRKKESREIAKKILEFGVTDSQKIDVMVSLAMSIEDNSVMKEITQFLKKYSITINKDDNSNTIKHTTNKILTN